MLNYCYRQHCTVNDQMKQHLICNQFKLDLKLSLIKILWFNIFSEGRLRGTEGQIKATFALSITR